MLVVGTAFLLTALSGAAALFDGEPAATTEASPSETGPPSETSRAGDDTTSRAGNDTGVTSTPPDAAERVLAEVVDSEMPERNVSSTQDSSTQELEGVATAMRDQAASYSGYRTITDDTGALSVEVPNEWAEVDGRPYTGEDGLARTDVRASSSLDDFRDGWSTPGMIFTASSAVAQSSSEVVLLDEFVTRFGKQCDYQGRQPYADSILTGFYDRYTSCGEAGVSYVVVGAAPPGREYVILVQVQANSDRDFEALDRILASFVVTGPV